MSQGDYIKRKQISHKLVGDGSTRELVGGGSTRKLVGYTNGNIKDNGLFDYNSVLNAKDYIDFKKYSLEGSIQSSTATLNDLVIPNQTKIFDMVMDVSNCPSFIICNDTDLRANRQPLKGFLLSKVDPSNDDVPAMTVMKAPGLSVPVVWDDATKKMKYKYAEPAFKSKTCNCINGTDFAPCKICNKY